MSERDEFGAFLVGFIVGGLTGAVAALLFAPQSGEETRALIKDRSIELRDKAQVTAEEALARAEAVAADARRRVEELTAGYRGRGASTVSEGSTSGVKEGGTSAIDEVSKITSNAASKPKKADSSNTPAA